eukprot:scaffold17242_cov126-Isochrysis_galbana.AAC.15
MEVEMAKGQAPSEPARIGHVWKHIRIHTPEELTTYNNPEITQAIGSPLGPRPRPPRKVGHWHWSTQHAPNQNIASHHSVKKLIHSPLEGKTKQMRP